MAAELDFRFWFQNTPVKEKFLSMLTAVDGYFEKAGGWRQFSIARLAPGNKEFEAENEITLPQLTQSLGQFSNEEELKYTVYIPVNSWRFSGNSAEKGAVMMALSCWGSEYGKRIGFNQNLEGNAQISILSTGPYTALLDESPAAQELNQKVEENINTLLELIQHVIGEISPRKVLGFSDAGDYVLSNAHLAFFENNQVLSEAIGTFLELLKVGEDQYEIPAIGHSNIASNGWFFHSWRSQEQKQGLREKLLQASQRGGATEIHDNQITAVLQSGKYDFFDKGESILLLDYPHFLNAFLDNFFLDVILERMD